AEDPVERRPDFMTYRGGEAVRGVRLLPGIGGGEPHARNRGRYPPAAAGAIDELRCDGRNRKIERRTHVFREAGEWTGGDDPAVGPDDQSRARPATCNCRQHACCLLNGSGGVSVGGDRKST